MRVGVFLDLIQGFTALAGAGDFSTITAHHGLHGRERS